MAITAKRALYIKLGEKNRWAHVSFETDTLRFGFHELPHDQALTAAKASDFRAVKELYEALGAEPGTATRYSNEVREFYTAGADVLWITFADGRMWWCFADAEIVQNTTGDPEATGSRYRKAINGWNDKDLFGRKLLINELRGSLTTTAGFRGTICRVGEFDYLLRRLNGDETTTTKTARDARSALINAMIHLSRGLHWKDFELLVELVMTQGGWRRVSATGGTQKTIDLELELPFTGARALVQIKSELSQGEVTKVTKELTEAAEGRRVFLVYHSPDRLFVDLGNVSLIGPAALAEHVVDVGLATWVMSKVG
jgi:hypothetical protein